MKEQIKSISSTTKRIYERWQRQIEDTIDLRASRTIDIKDCKSVCLALGPYRNLTTLTAAIVFLHPNCQVLNHADIRIYGNKQIDFLSEYREKRFNHFIQYAIHISTKGRRGRYGGSITRSHAFNPEYIMKTIHLDAGGELLKQRIECLFWKESLRTSNLIRRKNVDLGSIFERDERLRFLMPIRNPLDCAISNLRTHHKKIFEGLTVKPSETEVLEAVLDEILWFVNLKKEFPERFFYYFEHEISREMLINLATFLRLDPSDPWLTNALAAMKIKSGYNHRENLVAHYQQYVNDKFTHLPALSEGLMYFIKNEKKMS